MTTDERSVLVLLLGVVALGVGSVWGSQRPGSPRQPLPRPQPPGVGASGLVFHLGDGDVDAEPVALVARPPAEPLSDAETLAVLERLPAAPEEARREPFALRERSLPPPRPGRTLTTAFPPDAAAEPTEREAAGPLRVLRHQPEGEVDVAPRLSISFSRPMVALGSHDALSREAVPLRLSPEVAGEWRWIGTRTLAFEPQGRFPMATEFRATLPAGTRAADGSVLADTLVWSFATPAPRLLVHHPGEGPARREPVIFASFDQRIDPLAVLAKLSVRAGRTALAVRLATEAERGADATVARLVEQAEPGRWLAFVPERPLPVDSAVEVAFAAGTPSAEGPRRTAEAQRFSFRTFGAFRVKRHECGWGGRCTPFQPWRIETTNPIDAKTVGSDGVEVEPALAGLQLAAAGTTLTLRGGMRGRTSYRVMLSSRIKDVFGQPLEAPRALAFTVGQADPALIGPAQDLAVLDPAGARAVSVYSVNHPALRVRAYAVRPSDWSAWRSYRQRAWTEEGATPPGRLVIDATVRVAAAPDELVETPIDLAPALVDGLGQVALVVLPAARSQQDRRSAVRVWVQSTRIGLDAFADGERLVAWASELADGRPLSGVSFALGADGDTDARTLGDAQGLARFRLGPTPAPLLVARRGGDVAFLPSQDSWWGAGEGWRRAAPRETLRFSVFDDRGLYRPGEQVRVKGWLRRIGAGPRGDVEPIPREASAVDWTLRDAQGNQVAEGAARLGPLGAFDLALTLPPTMNLGPAALRLLARDATLDGREYFHRFQVQEFRRPEFEVTTSASEGPHVVGGSAAVGVKAGYYAGGALPGADVSWRVSSRRASFRPPNREDFVFGSFVPWWEPRGDRGAPEQVQTLAARTDGSGVHRLRIDLDRVEPPRPHLLQAEATVIDVNRQAWSASARLLVHPSLHYVGLRAERPFVRKGEPVALELIVTDLDGAALAGRRTSLRFERLDWEQQGGEWKQVPKDAQEREVDSAAEPARVRFEPREGGTWRVLARTRDDAGRPNETELHVWVAGGRLPPRRQLEQERLTLVPDRKQYAAGDVAQVLVVAPFAPAEGLLTLRRSGLLREERFTLGDGSHTLAIPIEEGFTPGVRVQVDLVGAAARDDAGPQPIARRPAFATGTIELPVPPLSRTLALEVRPRETALAPGQRTEIDLVVQDAHGRPVADAEATVVVVDEAVLALTGYRLPDPLAAFYAPREPGVADQRLRPHVLLARPQVMDELQPSRSGGVAALETLSVETAAGSIPRPAPAAMPRQKAAFAAAEEAPPPPIAMRTDFAALALFAAGVTTDASGRARVPVELPDSLTRYRVMAVAAAGARQFGAAEATLTARLPLMVRPSPPRFLNFGDVFSLPVVVQNQTDRALKVDVAVRASNATLTAGAGRRLMVAAHDRAEALFPMAAALAGTARIQVAAVSGEAADAAEAQFPVWTPATTEAFATYGEIDDGAVAQPLRPPEDAVPHFGGLEVTTSSTALQALSDAVLYLVAYPYECAEQLASRLLAVAALRDVLAAFAADGLPAPREIERAAERDLERLRALQNDDGGFGFWRRGDASWPYVSIHVAHALARAKAKGFSVPDAMLERSRGYLRGVERRVPASYPKDVERLLVAYALSVRALSGDADAGAARALVRAAGVDELSLEALGFVLPILSRDAGSAAELTAVRRRLANAVVETAGAAHFTVSYSDGAHLVLHSDRRADAILLEALIADQPRSDLVPKLVAGLLGQRKAGRWTNTQENVFVLLALDRYFQTYERETPDFVARLWLGERYAGEHAFRGRSSERQQLEVPMAALRAAGAGDLLLAKQGPGRLYYRIGLRYAPDSLVLAPLDRGFTVERRYEAVDDPGDVRREADGSWRVRGGARVRVRLTMVAPGRRHHVALVDPLPAGLEAQNPALAVTGSVPAAASDVALIGAPGLGGPRVPGHWWRWSRPWFEHQNLRDERVEAFCSQLFEGVYSYAYVARATTPGSFVVPPAKAEEMYAPETFGRGASDRVIVE